MLVDEDEDQVVWLAAQVDLDERYAATPQDVREAQFKQRLLDRCRYYLTPEDEAPAFLASEISDLLVSLYESRTHEKPHIEQKCSR